MKTYKVIGRGYEFTIFRIRREYTSTNIVKADSMKEALEIAKKRNRAQVIVNNTNARTAWEKDYCRLWECHEMH